jgi:S-adenosylmethionine synthetase
MKNKVQATKRMMYGYASNETEEYMPLPIILAHKLTQKLTEVRKSGVLSYLRPDGKSQVSVEYENGKPKRVDTVVISTQHAGHVTHDEIEKDIIKHVVTPVCSDWMDLDTIFHINPNRSIRSRRPICRCRINRKKDYC